MLLNILFYYFYGIMLNEMIYEELFEAQFMLQTVKDEFIWHHQALVM